MQVTDQLQRIVTIPENPKRIVSLVPSQTELLCTLGLENNIAGITKFCVHPEHVFRSKTKVGGTKNIDHEKIDSLSPDLIIANKEENQADDIKLLEKKFPVWVSDVKDLDSAVEMIRSVGRVTGNKKDSEFLAENILTEFTKVKKSYALKVIYLIWNNPFMTIGNDTFIHDIITRCGWTNVFEHTHRYPVVSDEDIRRTGADIIFLSSEPFPFTQKHAAEISEKFQMPAIVVDGEYFSWYGSRLAGSPDYLNKLIPSIEKHIRLNTSKTR